MVAVPSAEWGEAVHAEVVLRDPAGVDHSGLIAHARAATRAAKAPKSILFVDGLPLSAVGKVLRRKVQEKYWEGQARRVS